MKGDAKAGLTGPQNSTPERVKLATVGLPFKKGQSGNPGGISKEVRQARDLMNADLSTDAFREAWRKGYLSALENENPVILKDYSDRMLGKVKEQVELSQDPDAPLNPHALVSVDELKAIARFQLEQERKK